MALTPLPDWHVALLRAAKRRANVRLLDGREAELVYVPGTPPYRKVRHGDPTQCGVRFPGHSTSRIYPVPIEDIIEILPNRKEQP